MTQVGINVTVPVPLPFSSINGSKASFAGDLNICGDPLSLSFTFFFGGISFLCYFIVNTAFLFPHKK